MPPKTTRSMASPKMPQAISTSGRRERAASSCTLMTSRTTCKGQQPGLSRAERHRMRPAVHPTEWQECSITERSNGQAQDSACITLKPAPNASLSQPAQPHPH